MRSNKEATGQLSSRAKLGLTLAGIVGSGALALLYIHGRARRQLAAPLTLDGEAPTAPAQPARKARPVKVTPIAQVVPLPVLAHGRKPRITSHHKDRNPSRPAHDGVDYLYPVLPGDPPWKRGDGEGATSGRWIVPRGTPAIAVNAGRVQLAGNTPTGWRVWIDHGPVRTGYFHLSELFVSEGDEVVTGQQLGLVGDNPKVPDPRHLHFEVSPVKRYAPVDPVPYLQGAAFMPLAETTGPVRDVEIARPIA